MQLGLPTAIGVLFLPAFAGCLEQPAEDYQTPIVDLGFQATYALSDGQRLSLTLENGGVVMDATGEKIAAWRLIVAQHKADDSLLSHATYYVDRDYRVIRSDARCFYKTDGNCTHAFINWSQRGALAPFGLGLPRSNSPLVTAHWGTDHVIRTQRGIADGKLHITIENRIPGIPDGAQPLGTFIFESGENLPIHFSSDLRDGMTEGNRINVSWATPLPPAGRLTNLTSVDGGPRIGYFPGDEKDDFGYGVTHRAAIDWLRSQQPGADPERTGGCIAGYSAMPLESASIATLVDSYRIQFEVWKIDSDGSKNKWLFHWEDEITGGGTFYFDGSEKWNDATTCDHVGESPWPQVSSKEFMEIANRIVTEKRSFLLFIHTIAPSYLWGGGKTYGYDQYIAQYQPKSVKGAGVEISMPLAVEFAPNGGHLLYVMIDPADVTRLDDPATRIF